MINVIIFHHTSTKQIPSIMTCLHHKQSKSRNIIYHYTEAESLGLNLPFIPLCVITANLARLERAKLESIIQTVVITTCLVLNEVSFETNLLKNQ